VQICLDREDREREGIRLDWGQSQEGKRNTHDASHSSEDLRGHGRRHRLGIRTTERVEPGAVDDGLITSDMLPRRRATIR
jgi:hypothetical protein